MASATDFDVNQPSQTPQKSGVYNYYPEQNSIVVISTRLGDCYLNSHDETFRNRSVR